MQRFLKSECFAGIDKSATLRVKDSDKDRPLHSDACCRQGRIAFGQIKKVHTLLRPSLYLRWIELQKARQTDQMGTAVSKTGPVQVRLPVAG